MGIFSNYFILAVLFLILSCLCPREESRSYIRFVTSLILAVMVLGPLVQLMRTDGIREQMERIRRQFSQREEVEFSGSEILEEMEAAGLFDSDPGGASSSDPGDADQKQQ